MKILVLGLFFSISSLAYDNLNLQLDFSDLKNPAIEVQLSFVHPLELENRFNLVSEFQPTTGFATKVTAVKIDGTNVDYTYEKNKLVIISKSSKPNAVFEVLFSLPKINKMGLTNPLGISNDNSAAGHLYMMSIGFTVLPTPENIIFSHTLHNGTLKVLSPQGWKIWSNADFRKDFDQTTATYSLQNMQIYQMGIFASADLQRTEIPQSHSFKSVIYRKQDNPDQFLQLALDILPNVEAYFDAKYGGIPSHREKEFIWLGDSYTVALSNQDSIYLSTALYRDTFTPEEIFAHEISHTWFAHILALPLSDLGNNAWLSEGFATYEGLQFLLFQNKMSDFHDRMSLYLDKIKNKNSNVITNPYLSGAMLHMYLSQQIGVENYTRQTTLWIQNHAGEEFKTDDWLNNLSANYPDLINTSEIKKLILLKGDQFWRDHLKY